MSAAHPDAFFGAESAAEPLKDETEPPSGEEHRTLIVTPADLPTAPRQVSSVAKAPKPADDWPLIKADDDDRLYAPLPGGAQKIRVTIYGEDDEILEGRLPLLSPQVCISF